MEYCMQKMSINVETIIIQNPPMEKDPIQFITDKRVPGD